MQKEGRSHTESANQSPQSRLNQNLLKQCTGTNENVGESPLPTFASQSPGQNSPNVRLVSRQVGGVERISVTLTIPARFQPLETAGDTTSAYS